MLEKLEKLQCHFTWDLTIKNFNLNDIKNRLNDDIRFYLGKDSSLGWLYTFLGFIKYLQNNHDEAVKSLQKAEELIKKHNEGSCEKQLIVTYGDFAWLHYHMGDLSQSQSYLHKLKEIMDKFPPPSNSVFYAEVYGEMGWTFLKYNAQYYLKAVSCFQKALEQERHNPEWNTGYAIALYRTTGVRNDKGNRQVIQQLRRTLEISSEDPVIMVLLGLTLFYNHQQEEASEWVEKALRISPGNPQLTRYVGKFYLRSGKLDKAEAYLRNSLEMTPTSAFIQHMLALCYRDMRKVLLKKRDDETSRGEADRLLHLAIEHLELATSRRLIVQSGLDLALLYAEDQNFTKAEELFKKAKESAKEDPHTLQLFNQNYGDFQLYHKKSEPEAIKHYKESLKIQKDSPLGKQCALKLMKLANKRIHRNAQDSEAFGILGYVHHIRDNTREAIACYDEALLHDPENGEFLAVLCDLRLSLP